MCTANIKFSLDNMFENHEANIILYSFLFSSYFLISIPKKIEIELMMLSQYKKKSLESKPKAKMRLCILEREAESKKVKLFIRF